MKKQELCIGDWVWNPQNHQAEQVVELREHQVMLAYNDLYAYDDIEPLAMTDLLMQQNGFKEDGIIKHWWRRSFGEKRVSVCLHEVMGKIFSYDFWVDQPYDYDNRQTKACQVVNSSDRLTIIKEDDIRRSMTDIDGLHLLQHALTSAGIEMEWQTEIKRQEEQEPIRPSQLEMVTSPRQSLELLRNYLPAESHDRDVEFDPKETGLGENPLKKIMSDASVSVGHPYGTVRFKAWSAERLLAILPERINLQMPDDLKRYVYRNGDRYVVRYESDCQEVEYRESSLVEALYRMALYLLKWHFTRQQLKLESKEG